MFLILEPAAALEEWRRVLRPGGKIGISVSGGGDRRWYEEMLLAYGETYSFALSRLPRVILPRAAGEGTAEGGGGGGRLRDRCEDILQPVLLQHIRGLHAQDGDTLSPKPLIAPPIVAKAFGIIMTGAIDLHG